MRLPVLTILLTVALAGCGGDGGFGDLFDNDDNDSVEADAGLVSVEAQTDDATVDSVVATLTGMLNDNENITVVNVFDHAANAASVGMALPPTQVVIFGNPLLGTPLMQEQRTTGIDLPQKFLVYQTEDGDIAVVYNSTTYLMDRHGLVDSDDTLDTIAGALSNFAGNATGVTLDDDVEGDPQITLREGVVTMISDFDFLQTADRLNQAILDNPNLTLLTNLAPFDHSANAASVSMSLGPTQLFVFGNPELGTPLMQSEATIGIDLPQKMLVYQIDDGTTFVAFNDPEFLAERHGIDDQDDILETIRGALDGLAEQATSETEAGS